MKASTKNLTLIIVFSSLIIFSNALADPADAKAKELIEIKAELSKSWTRPAVKRSETVSAKKYRVINSSVSYGIQNSILEETPEDESFKYIGCMPEPFVPVAEATSIEERRALAFALRAYMKNENAEAVEPLKSFVADYPDSAWTPGLLLNLGIIAYDTGYFSEALDHWNTAWNLVKGNSDRHSVVIANRAIAEYAKMCARIGRKDDLAIIFKETEGRIFQGTAKVLMDNAQEGYWSMLNKSGIAYRCGPYALTNLASELLAGSEAACAEFLKDIVSPDTGFSLAQVQAMSEELNLDLQMAKRSVGAKVIVPSVVHWKVGHYGALTREMNGKYLLKDPTFGNETWMSAQAIDRESSGYFLIPSGELPSGWDTATESEAMTVFGKGHSGNGGEGETAQDDQKNGGDDCDKQLAMATYTFHTLLASLSISDTPVGYSAAYGPDVRLRVTYNQREFGQSATINYTNFSPRWVSNWVSYLEDNPSSPGANITLYLRGGGSETHTGFDTSTQAYERDVQSSAILVKLTPDTYKKVYPDGSEEHYEHFIGTTGTRRKVFLTRVVDPQGNAVTLHYDEAYPSRLQYVSDATGLSTEFFYTYPDEPYLVSRVEDPYGRMATFSYADFNGTVRLKNIEDVYGIISSFGYDSSGGITELTTPYGTTNFELSPFRIGGYDLIRYIEATDPYGDKERIEYNLSASQTGIPGSINEPLPDSSKVAYLRGDNDDRNSFYWDKQQMKYGAGDYSKAHLYHWIQPTSADSATSILESEKPPLEGRIWYNYPGQSVPYIQGDIASPSVIGRVVENETGALVTQASRFEYNALGNLTKSIDPLGRETLIEYAANGIDVLFTKQRTGGTEEDPVYSTLASYTYNADDPPHRPRTFTDSSGSTTTFSYNTYGQILTVTNELDETIIFSYETDTSKDGYGRVLSITGNVPGGNVSYTYDSFDRIRTETDSEGYTLTYDYDALNRVTLITYPDGSYEQFDYENHSMVASRDREGRWTRYFHDAFRRPVLEMDPLGQFTQYEWCRCGDIRKLIDSEGNITHWVRDIQGRVTEKRFADGTSYRFTYLLLLFLRLTKIAKLVA
jgi:YD repeat-containing protein